MCSKNLNILRCGNKSRNIQEQGDDLLQNFYISLQKAYYSLN